MLASLPQAQGLRPACRRKCHPECSQVIAGITPDITFSRQPINETHRTRMGEPDDPAEPLDGMGWGEVQQRDKCGGRLQVETLSFGSASERVGQTESDRVQQICQPARGHLTYPCLVRRLIDNV